MEYIITTLQLSTKKASLIVSPHKNPPAYHFRIIATIIVTFWFGLPSVCVAEFQAEKSITYKI